ncbi:hypothetical protein SMD27_21600 [Dongia soli]|uniref:FAD dependent oxidoreductase n=1 Tax=Dongia soli TaxID=600628 RepID=A0ABU5EH17_9PROT|nr:hypothetical protein [Dongia soli]MDY0885450.1 hypothetical protein [Dongia soli]
MWQRYRKLSGVVTERGTIKCRHVVVAAGAWSSLLLRPLGIRLPQLTITEATAVPTTLPMISTSPSRAPVLPFESADGGYTMGYGPTVAAENTRDSFRCFGDFLPLMKSEWRSIRLRAGRRSRRGFHPSAAAGAGFGSDERVLDRHRSPATFRRLGRTSCKPCLSSARHGSSKPGPDSLMSHRMPCLLSPTRRACRG